MFLGTPHMAVPPLRALVAAGHDVVRVITRVDKRRGRGGQLVPSPVKVAADELGIPVGHDPDEVIAAAEHGAELGVVVAYGRIIKPHQLAALPMVNLHFSLLPRWRGAAPVERALLAGDADTGVCVMAMEEGLDTGGVYARAVVPIGAETTADELRAELVDVGTRLLVDQLAAPLADWIADPEPQAGEVTYAASASKSSLRPPLGSSARGAWGNSPPPSRPSPPNPNWMSFSKSWISSKFAVQCTGPCPVPARPRRSIVLRSPSPNCVKSHVRPS